jgi:MSHA biogenesis protein MshO
MAASRQGFSLIEMITVLLLMGIVGAASAMFIRPAVLGFQAQTQRATLVDEAENALRRMARDIRIAVPNSVRITQTSTTFFALEMVPTVDGGRYCATGLADCSGATQVLRFTGGGDDEFDILGCFRDSTFTGSLNVPLADYRLVVGNTGDEIYTGSPAVITPSATSITLSETSGACGTGTSRHHLVLSALFLFGTQSPRQRVFVVQESASPVTYLCNAVADGSGTLKRYSGYSFQGPQPTTAATLTGAGATETLVANGLSACSIASLASDVQNSGIVILSVGLTKAGETVSLMHQAQLDNSQ